jgi:hypothetical protein
MVEFFDVRREDEASFRAAWAAGAPGGATLHRALREDTRPRFAALSEPPGPNGGTLLVADRPSDLDAVVARWKPHHGFISARLDGDLVVAHWSSPLMYQRAVQAAGELVERAALYGPGVTSQRAGSST